MSNSNNNNCKEEFSHSTIVLKDKKSGGAKATFTNKQRVNVEKHTVDHCEKISGKKCDYILTTTKRQSYVELKGGEYEEAAEQLAKTINRFHSSEHEIKVYAFGTGFPKMNQFRSSAELKFRKFLNKGFRSKYRIDFIPSKQEVPVE